MVLSSKNSKKKIKKTSDLEIVDASSSDEIIIDHSTESVDAPDDSIEENIIFETSEELIDNENLMKNKSTTIKPNDDSVNDSLDDQELKKTEEKVRPKNFKEIIGREQEKRTIKMMINAAKERGEVIDHILFYGPPGLGKTTFAVSIANEVGSSLRITSGPAIERQGDLAAILTNLKRNDILFIDEIHRLSRVVEEILYPAMEDGVIDIIMGKGPSAKTIRLNLEPFTLIGATTQIGRISSPMRERFGLIQRLDYFSDEDLSQIVSRVAGIDSINIDAEALNHIASRARGTGRVALRLYRRVRDFYITECKGEDCVTLQMVGKALDMLGIDDLGLEHIDRKLLQIMYDHFGGGPVGLSTLSAAISEDITTISDVYEPFLLKLGLIKRTPRGRVLTEKGIEYVLKDSTKAKLKLF